MSKHGAPDWSIYRPKSTTFSLLDLSELAARLGSIVTFDRRGDLIFMDDFSHGLTNWKSEPLGTGASVTTSPTTARTGGYAAKLVTGSASHYYTSISHYSPYTTLSKTATEMSFTIHATMLYIRLLQCLYDGANATQVAVSYYPLANKLYYMNGAGSPILLQENLDLDTGVNLFHTLKIVADLPNKSYARIILNETTHILTVPAFTFTAPLFSPQLYVQILAYGVAGSNKTVYIDDVIITQDEP